MKGMYSDEWTGGVEYEVMPHTSVGVKVIHRSLGRAIEDFLDNVTGEYFIGNPSEGTFGQTMGSFAGDNVPAPKPERKNTALELTLRKRYSDNWQFLASYVWEEARRQLRRLVSGVDRPARSGHQLGLRLRRLPRERPGPLEQRAQEPAQARRQLHVEQGDAQRADRGRLVPLVLRASADRLWLFVPAYGNWEYYLTPRGSLGRSPADYEADVQVTYPLKLGPNVHADLQIAVFNLFNRQAINQLYSRYNEIADGSCAGIPAAICNGDNGLAHIPGTITPVAQLANPTATATSPDFLKAGVGFTAPRSARIGVRFRF